MGGGFGRRADPNAPRAGANLEMSLRVTLLEAANGTTRNLEIPHQDACAACGGSGAKPGTKPKVCDICGGRGQVETMSRTPFGQFVTMTTCQRCGGTGKVIEERCETCGGQGCARKNHKVEVKIPAGVETGTRLRVTGEGDSGLNGGPKGDLFLVLSVDRHEKFERDGGDLHTYLTLSYPQAVLGATVEIDTLIDGREKVGVPAGTEHGRVLKIKGKGMPRLRGARGRGDLYAHVLIDIPTKLTDKQKSIIESLSKEMGETVETKEESFFDKMKKMF